MLALRAREPEGLRLGIKAHRRRMGALSTETRRDSTGIDRIQPVRRVDPQVPLPPCSRTRPATSLPRPARRTSTGPRPRHRSGHANTLVYAKGRGIVLNEPSVIALNRDRRGAARRATTLEDDRAHARLHRRGAAAAGGAITDHEITERMIRLLLHHGGSPLQPAGVLICVPSAITEVERRGGSRRPSGPGPSTRSSSSSRWPRPSARACRSTLPWAAWSSTSAVAPRRRR